MSSPTPRIAIVGSGPSGFFATDAVLRTIPGAAVDMFERFPVPYGLVRHGVAPDQAKIKSVTRAFARIATNQHFGFYGNVTIGDQLSIEDLRRCYDGIIIATGALWPRRLGIPGEELPGCHMSTDFVCWYNGHPDYSQASYDLSHERAVVIGNGNVALDVARVLAKGAEGLAHTEIADHALKALAASNVREIVILGRRGPAQASFTLVELGDFLKLEQADAVIGPVDRQLNAASEEELASEEGWLKRRLWNVLEQFPAEIDPAKPRHIRFRFLASPVRLLGESKVEGVEIAHNRLEGPAGSQQAVPTGETEVIPAGLVVVCVGYRGTPLPGVPFDERRGIIPNVDGRVTEGDAPVPGLYAVEWIRHAARGVIGDTKADSAATVHSLAEDLPCLPQAPERDPEAITHLLEARGMTASDFAAWEKLDAEELRRGQETGKTREKFTHIHDMMAYLRQLDAE